MRAKYAGWAQWGWAVPAERGGTGQLPLSVCVPSTSLDLYANVIHCKSLPGVVTRHRDIDILIVRENTEGEYSSLEHEVSETWATSSLPRVVGAREEPGEGQRQGRLCPTSLC